MTGGTVNSTVAACTSENKRSEPKTCRACVSEQSGKRFKAGSGAICFFTTTSSNLLSLS